MISSLIVDLMMELLFILSSKDSIYLLVLVGIQWCVIIEIKEGGDHYRTKKNLHQSVIELMKTVKQNRSLINCLKQTHLLRWMWFPFQFGWITKSMRNLSGSEVIIHNLQMITFLRKSLLRKS